MTNTAAFEYVKAPTGTVHLVRTDVPLNDRLATLCGRLVGGWIIGDDTLSGVAATCQRCRNLMHSRRPAVRS